MLLSLILAIAQSPTAPDEHGLLLATNPGGGQRPTETAAPAFDTLRVEQASQTPHGTLLVEERWKPGPSPYLLVTEDGRELRTQWDRVVSLAAGDVVELSGFSESPVRGLLRVRKGSPQPRIGLSLFDPEAVAIAAGLMPVSLQVDDGPVVTLGAPWAWTHRLGSARITVGRQVDIGGMRALVWADIRAGSKQVDWQVTLHNCGAPVHPDVYFRAVRVLVPSGWEAEALLPDGAQDLAHGLLVTPLEDDAEHVLPRLARRPFRFAVHPENRPLQADGWGTSRWNRQPQGSTNPYERLGGFLPHGISVPDLSLVSPPFAGELAQERASLLAGTADPLYGGSLAPPAKLWPCRGVKYGGGTSGTDVTQFPGVAEAFFADQAGLELLRIEALRYAARQRGHLLASDGDPLPIGSLLGSGGAPAVKLFNNAFGRAGDDGQLGWFAADDGQPGRCPYELELAAWDPIDSQHLIRWMRSRLALVWLDNDPTSAHEIRSQALDCMLAMWGKVHGAVPYGGPGNGTPWGRGEAWDALCVATAYALDGDPRKLDFLRRWSEHVEAAQMPSGLVSRLESGKVWQNFPMGHYFSDATGLAFKPCLTGLHEGSENVGDYAAGRSNEQCYVLIAHRAIRKVCGIGSSDFEGRLCKGMEQLAWATKPDGSLAAGVLDRYPCAVLTAMPATYSAPFTTRADVPDWGVITSAGSWNATDTYDCGSAIGFGAEAGVLLIGPLRAYSGQPTLDAARRWFETQGLRDIGSRAITLECLQRFGG